MQRCKGIPSTSLNFSHGFLMAFSWLSHGLVIECVHLAIPEVVDSMGLGIPFTSLNVSHGFLMAFSWISHRKAIA